MKHFLTFSVLPAWRLYPDGAREPVLASASPIAPWRSLHPAPQVEIPRWPGVAAPEVVASWQLFDSLSRPPPLRNGAESLTVQPPTERLFHRLGLVPLTTPPQGCDHAGSG